MKQSLKFLLLILIVTALLLTSCNAQPKALQPEISVTDAHDMYQKGEAYFVDVREQEEWDALNIPNTTLIPLGQLANRLSEIPKDKTIVVVCRSGNRSKNGRDILIAAGFANVTSMAGGINEWRSQGYPVQE